MNKPNAKALTQRLLESARKDGPSAAQRAQIWQKVALAPQLSLVASVATASSHPGPLVAGAAATKTLGGVAAGSLSAGKLLLVGALAGSVLTVGLAALFVHDLPHDRAGLEKQTAGLHAGATHGGAANAPAMPPVVAPPGAAVAAGNEEAPAAVTDELDPPSHGESVSRAGQGEPSTAQAPARGAQARGAVANRLQGDDRLMREAAVVSEARTDIVQGRAAAALERLDALGRDGAQSLEPEELSLRVRALRLLGRDVEADQVEQTLRARFPDNFLAR